MNFKERYQYNPQNDLLGKGGFSKVYKAYDKLFERHVALKFYESNVSEKYNLISEVKRTVTLIHKNLVQYYDAQIIEINDSLLGKKTQQVGILEYVDGGDFRQFIKKIPEPERFKNLIAGILEGLQFLHDKGLVHRDIKPHNILLSKKPPTWETKLTDFGLSKQIKSDYTVSSAIVGTMEYMAPEQINPEKFGINGRLGTNLDLWAFGVVLYELLFGFTPFRRGSQESKATILTGIVQNQIPANINQAPAPYNQIISRCLVKEAAKRAQSANELLDILNKRTTAEPANRNYSNQQKVNPIATYHEKSEPDRNVQKFYLLDYSGVLNQKKFSINGQLYIGRDYNSCQVVYPVMESGISRKHALVSKDAGNNVFIEDLGSSNGTFVNSRKLAPHERKQLNAGDWICLGGNKIILQLTNG